MRFKTYLRYVAAGGGMVILLAGAAWPQTQSEAKVGPVVGNEGAANCPGWGFDNAQMKRDLGQIQREQKARSNQFRTRARQLQAEVRREMADNINHAEMGALAARLQSEKTGIEDLVAAAAQAGKTQQIFAQDSILDAEDTGWLGVEVTEVTAGIQKQANLPRLEGVYVSDVLADSPASAAGLQDKDVIVNYDGQAVEGTVQFRRLVRETPPGRDVQLSVYRGGKEQNLKVQVGNRDRAVQTQLREVKPLRAFNFDFRFPEFFPAMGPTLGIEAEDISGQLASYFHVPGGAGVLVEQVNANTPAAKAGLKAGDVIIKAGNASVKTIGDLRDQLRDQRSQKTITLTIVRGGSQTSVAVALEHPEEHALPVRSATL